MIKKAIPDTAIYTVDAAHKGSNPITVKADMPHKAGPLDLTTNIYGIQKESTVCFGENDESDNEEPPIPVPDIHSNIMLTRKEFKIENLQKS